MKSAARHRLDLLAQAADRQAMDARQQPALAELFGLASPAGGSEVKRPRRTLPSASSRPSAASTRATGRPRRCARLRAVAGPIESIQPRTTATAASSASTASAPVGFVRTGGSERPRLRKHGAQQVDPFRRDQAAPYRCAPVFASVLGDDGAAVGDQRVEMRAPLAGVLLRQQAERQQRVVQLVGVADVGPRLAAHLGDGLRRRARRSPPRGPDRCAAATPRGRGAPRAARRRGRRRGWR